MLLRVVGLKSFGDVAYSGPVGEPLGMKTMRASLKGGGTCRAAKMSRSALRKSMAPGSLQEAQAR